MLDSETVVTTTLAGIRFEALGTQVEVFSDAAESLASQLRSLVAEYEARFSRFRANSELQQLCRTAGAEVAVSDDMFDVLSLAARFWEETSGIFDPLVRPSLEAAGYDRTFHAVEPSSAAPAPPPLTQPHTFGDAQLNAARRSVRLPHGASLDLGGIAKGWIVDRLGDFMANYGPFLVDIGGDMVARGDGPDGGPGWLLSIADPEHSDLDLAWLRLRDRAIATSTTMRRRWQRNGQWLHHIIDPRTGAPAFAGVTQVTTVAATAVEADICAKTAIVLGEARGLDWLEARDEQALLVTERGPVATLRWPALEVPMSIAHLIERAALA